ncbi:MAG: hypothetical protein R6U78_13575, partial [Bacteroidales bacterium]
MIYGESIDRLRVDRLAAGSLHVEMDLTVNGYINAYDGTWDSGNERGFRIGKEAIEGRYDGDTQVKLYAYSEDNEGLAGKLSAGGNIVWLDNEGIKVKAVGNRDSVTAANKLKFMHPDISTGTPVGEIYTKIARGASQLTMKGRGQNGHDGYVRLEASGPDGLSYAWLESTATRKRFAIKNDTDLDVSGNVRMKQNVKIGQDVEASYKLDVYGNLEGAIALFYNAHNTSTAEGVAVRVGGGANPDATFVEFRDGDDDTIGGIAGDGSGGVCYAQTSDIRLKNVLGDLTTEEALRALRTV